MTITEIENPIERTPALDLALQHPKPKDELVQLLRLRNAVFRVREEGSNTGPLGNLSFPPASAALGAGRKSPANVATVLDDWRASLSYITRLAVLSFALALALPAVAETCGSIDNCSQGDICSAVTPTPGTLKGTLDLDRITPGELCAGEGKVGWVGEASPCPASPSYGYPPNSDGQPSGVNTLMISDVVIWDARESCEHDATDILLWQYCAGGDLGHVRVLVIPAVDVPDSPFPPGRDLSPDDLRGPYGQFDRRHPDFPSLHESIGRIPKAAHESTLFGPFEDSDGGPDRRDKCEWSGNVTGPQQIDYIGEFIIWDWDWIVDYSEDVGRPIQAETADGIWLMIWEGDECTDLNEWTDGWTGGILPVRCNSDDVLGFWYIPRDTLRPEFPGQSFDSFKLHHRDGWANCNRGFCNSWGLPRDFNSGAGACPSGYRCSIELTLAIGPDSAPPAPRAVDEFAALPPNFIEVCADTQQTSTGDQLTLNCVEGDGCHDIPMSRFKGENLQNYCSTSWGPLCENADAKEAGRYYTCAADHGLHYNQEYTYRIDTSDVFGNTSNSEPVSLHALAQTPSRPSVVREGNEVIVGSGNDYNPDHTEYALYDVTSGCWLDLSAICSPVEVWAPRNLWSGLTLQFPATDRPFLAFKARNGDKIVTPLGPAGTTLAGADHLVNGGVPDGTTTARVPKIASTADGVFHAIWSEDRGSVGVYLATSTDSGETWQTPPVRLSGGVTNVGGAALATSNTGVVFAAWLGVTGNEFKLQWTMSQDAGASWRSPQEALIVGEFGAGEFQACIAGGTTAHVTFIDRFSVSPVESHAFYAAIDLTTSTLLDLKQLDLDTDEGPLALSGNPSISCDTNGNVVVAFAGSGGHVFMNRSHDDGQSWLPSAKRLSYGLPADRAGITYVRTALNGTGTAVIAFNVVGPPLTPYLVPNDDVYAVRSIDFGRTWSGTELVEGDSGPWYDRTVLGGVQVTESGVIHVVAREDHPQPFSGFDPSFVSYFRFDPTTAGGWESRVLNDGLAGPPVLLSDPRGRLAALWFAHPDQGYGSLVYITGSGDDGRTWFLSGVGFSTNQPQGLNVSPLTDWAAMDSSGNVVAVWEDERQNPDPVANTDLESIYSNRFAIALEDQDADGVSDPWDNCPSVGNPLQSDRDTDGNGDECDPCPLDMADDSDQDGVCLDRDNCAEIANPLQTDIDADGIGDPCDSCPDDSQNDVDGDGLCRDDDPCPLAIASLGVDSDEDGIDDACDLCPGIPDPQQEDRNADGVGDACGIRLIEPATGSPLVFAPFRWTRGPAANYTLVFADADDSRTPLLTIDVQPASQADSDVSYRLTASELSDLIDLMREIPLLSWGVEGFPDGDPDAVTSSDETRTLVGGLPDSDDDGFWDGVDPCPSEVHEGPLEDHTNQDSCSRGFRRKRPRGYFPRYSADYDSRRPRGPIRR